MARCLLRYGSIGCAGIGVGRSDLRVTHTGMLAFHPPAGEGEELEVVDGQGGLLAKHHATSLRTPMIWGRICTRVHALSHTLQIQD
eukprot:6554506-Alexandrium_andersonii.AAC.1